jgi:hypothetical protein
MDKPPSTRGLLQRWQIFFVISSVSIMMTGLKVQAAYFNMRAKADDFRLEVA